MKWESFFCLVCLPKIQVACEVYVLDMTHGYISVNSKGNDVFFLD